MRGKTSLIATRTIAIGIVATACVVTIYAISKGLRQVKLNRYKSKTKPLIIETTAKTLRRG